MRLSCAILIFVAGCHSAGNLAPLDNGRSLPMGNDHPRERALANRADSWRWLAPAAGPSPSILPDGGWTILPSELGPRLLADCTDGGLVKGIEAFWSPAPEKVAEVDAAVGELLALQVDVDGQPVSPLRRGLLSYYRQYIGARAGGRTLVYVAAYSAAEMGQISPSTDWRREPLGEVCDGGTYFFRAAFDVIKSKFVMFSYGSAWSCCDSLDEGESPICAESITCRHGW
jgi:hypothetical protein